MRNPSLISDDRLENMARDVDTDTLRANLTASTIIYLAWRLSRRRARTMNEALAIIAVERGEPA